MKLNRRMVSANGECITPWARWCALIIVSMSAIYCQCVYGAYRHLPITAPFGGVVPTATMRKNPAHTLIVGSLTVTFNRTTLGDIVNHFPSGKLFVTYDEGLSYTVCYKIAASKPTEYVWFISDDEMDGNALAINEIQATRRSIPETQTSQCGKLGTQTDVKFSNGIWIGSSSRKLNKVLGTPTAIKGEWQGYAYKGNKEYRIDGKPVSFGVLNFLEVHMKNDAVMEIDASEVVRD